MPNHELSALSKTALTVKKLIAPVLTQTQTEGQREEGREGGKGREREREREKDTDTGTQCRRQIHVFVPRER
jgi:hypothetical protein